jgi:RNA polymerase sigma-70 factor (ECF subfamily)
MGLVARGGDGGDDATRRRWNRLCRRYYGTLLGYSYSLVDDDAAAVELTHDVLLQALAKLEDDPWLPCLRKLKVMARRTAAEQHRAQADEVPLDPDSAVVGRLDLYPSLLRPDLVAEALDRVPTRERRALDLYVERGLEPAEAADLLGISEISFTRLLRRAGRRLKIEYDLLCEGLALLSAWLPSL